jgi:4-aminobutyrate aminotransferase/(S)-3-amino-2-methylpropionate transaminase
MQTVVFARGSGANVWDVDDNRFVDLAAGFGSLLLGHDPEQTKRAIDVQSARLLQAMGDVYPSDAKIGLLEQLVALYPEPGAQGILGLSGADAVSAALKTAALATERAGIVALGASYHGLSYGPLAACGLRESYRAPFAGQLNPEVTFLPYPGAGADVQELLRRLVATLETRRYGALIYEPILGRGGVIPMPPRVAQEIQRVCREHAVLLIADEVWTGLGRSGHWLYSAAQGVVPDLICLGKGLGGGLPISACLGRADVMKHWRRDPEVVHTSTFAGAPLSCVTALATLDALRRGALVERSSQLGGWLKQQLGSVLGPFGATVRGSGLMLGVDLGGAPGRAVNVMRSLLRRGYLISTGGGQRDVVVLTPPLTISKEALAAFVEAFAAVLADESTREEAEGRRL